MILRPRKVLDIYVINLMNNSSFKLVENLPLYTSEKMGLYEYLLVLFTLKNTWTVVYQVLPRVQTHDNPKNWMIMNPDTFMPMKPYILVG